METTESSNTTLLPNNNNNNYFNYNNTKSSKMTSAENTSYEDDFEKDTSSDSASQHQGRANDSSITNTSNNDSNSNNMSIKRSDDSYEDDFEKDLSMDESSKNISSSPRKSSDDDESSQQKTLPHVPHPPPTTAASSSRSDTNSGNSTAIRKTENEEGGASRESQHREGPPPLDLGANIAAPGSQIAPSSESVPSDNESEDADAYNFTEDQRRAMLELMVQKQEDVDLLDEEPPEYNVKGRLEQLNAELANDPAPVEGERETRVGFKAEIVDLVAPPPQDFSDDDTSQPNSAREDPQSEPSKPSPFSATSSESPAKQFVIERDGQFSVLSANELTPSERAMLMEEGAGEANNRQTQHSDNNRPKEGRSSGDGKGSSVAVAPRPPNQPRPNTAAASSGGGRRSFIRQGGQQSPRPKSADHHQQQGKRSTTSSSSHSSGLSDDFNYRSPYARSEEVREMSREQSRRQEEERREKERRRKEEEEQRRDYNNSAFEAWLRKKRAENQSRSDENQGDKKKSEDERVSHIDTTAKIKPHNFSSGQMKENDEAYKTWLKEKLAQGKKDKLLQRRQQQERMEGYFMRPREECEQAFKEWLKKKNADLRRQQSLERQRSKLYRVQVKRSRKTQALVRALKESQAFRYVDYY
ncbi:hypothetical protein EGW08_009248, partial [Elysia chlorotica]